MQTLQNLFSINFLFFGVMTNSHSAITSLLKLRKTSVGTRIAVKLPCVCWDWQVNCCVTWGLTADLRSLSAAGWLSSVAVGFWGGRRRLAKLCVAATQLEHNLSLFEVCNLSFKIFWHAQSKALPAQRCLCRGARERWVAAGTARCAIATLQPSQALPLQSARPASASHCISTCCFSPPPQLCPMSAAQQDASVPAQERAWGKWGDASSSLSCKSLCGEWAPKQLSCHVLLAGLHPPRSKEKWEKTRKFHDERWRRDLFRWFRDV